MAQGGSQRQRRQKATKACGVSQGVRDASTGGVDQDGAELSAALESPERRLFRPLGNYFAFIATKGSITRETILRIWIELEIVCLDPIPSLLCAARPITQLGRSPVWRLFNSLVLIHLLP